MKDDLKHLMRKHYLEYASYVILDRAIPNVLDGLKPVQRRILYTLHKIDDGKLHKVANVSGQTMALHPHGDAPINDALVNMANKGYLLDMQGNFGNMLTGDSAAASRYIETRLSPMAKETLFNPDLTELIPSYDARNKEPVAFPAKIPVLLMQGAEGIAVGMATRILPHNFVELLEAQIAILEGREFTLLPDFLTGGCMDASQYDKGRGKVKLRAKIDTSDPKRIVIREICHGTTTDSLVRSIDEAAKRGKIKIESISDYTADKVEIEITLPRGQYADQVVNALYAYTDCEVSVNSQVVVIRDNFPWEPTVDEILELNTEKLKEYLRLELEIEQARLLEKIFQKTLEQIFIENRLYKLIEDKKTYEEVHATIAKSLEPYHSQLERLPDEDDRERLLSIPIRRISRFDIEKNEKDIAAFVKALESIAKSLKRLKAYVISYLKGLLKKYGANFPRLTEIKEIEELNLKAIEEKQVNVGFDLESGFVGTKVSKGEILECSNFDKLLILFLDGSYKVINIPEKTFLFKDGKKVAYAGIADKKTCISVAYLDPKTQLLFAKRFIVSKFILDKEYRYLEENVNLKYLTTQENISLKVNFKPKAKQKVNGIDFHFNDVNIKGVSAKGIRVATKEVKKVQLLKQKESKDKQLTFDDIPLSKK
jgi:topoisomerase-4 subunit A